VVNWRLQPDLAQRAPGLRAARKFARLADAAMKSCSGRAAPPPLSSAAAAFAVISTRCRRPVDETPDPRLDRRRIRRSWMVNIGHCSIVRALSVSSRENCASSRVSRIQDAIAGQSVSHDLAPEIVIASSERRSNPVFFAARWIASLRLSSGAHRATRWLAMTISTR